MKRLFCILLVSLLLLPVRAAAQPQMELGAESAILMEKETGEVLLEKNSLKRLEPASVTKIMTLLLTMEALDAGRLDLEELVSVSARAAGMGGSQVYLKEGEQMSVRELLKCVTVVSGNDAAVALAERISGSEEAFVGEMNRRAQELGMTETNFVNCTGLPVQGHLTCARDIALMSRELILRHPDIRAYSTIWMDSIRDGSFGLTNTNRLIRFYPGATGLKTGSTDSALYCLSATAEREGMELIAVVLKSPSSAQRFTDAKALLDYGFSGWVLREVGAEQPLPPVPVILGERDQVQPQRTQTLRLLLRRGEEQELETRLILSESLEAPVEAGQTVGRLEILVGGEVRKTIPLTAAQRVERLSVSGIFTRILRGLFEKSGG